MGVDIDAYLEFDTSGASLPWQGEGFSTDAIGVIPFNDYGSLVSGKDYDFMGAISGVRAPQGKPLYSPRGLPPSVSPEVESAILEFYDPSSQVVGWLSLREIEDALAHMEVSYDRLSLAAQVVLRMMRSLESKLGEGRTRLVFGIE